MPLEPCFLCDRMLARLGRWLRAAGYDTLIAEGHEDDLLLLDRTAAEARVLLTCDRRLAERAGAAVRVVTMQGGDVAAQARELARGLGVDWLRNPFTRCVVDNAPLRAATARETEAAPPRIRVLGAPLSACPSCGRVYWEGGHHRRMRARLQAWRAAGAR